MARTKRALKLRERELIKPAPQVVVRVAVAKKLVGAPCWLCGRVIPEKRAIKAGRTTVDHIGYFAAIDWDPNKPFGVVYTPGGRGSFRNWEPIGPEDAPELYEAMKRRFLDALGECVGKGWITREEVERAIRE